MATTREKYENREGGIEPFFGQCFGGHPLMPFEFPKPPVRFRLIKGFKNVRKDTCCVSHEEHDPAVSKFTSYLMNQSFSQAFPFCKVFVHEHFEHTGQGSFHQQIACIMINFISELGLVFAVPDSENKLFRSIVFLQLLVCCFR